MTYWYIKLTDDQYEKVGKLIDMKSSVTNMEENNLVMSSGMLHYNNHAGKISRRTAYNAAF